MICVCEFGKAFDNGWIINQMSRDLGPLIARGFQKLRLHDYRLLKKEEHQGVTLGSCEAHEDKSKMDNVGESPGYRLPSPDYR